MGAKGGAMPGILRSALLLAALAPLGACNFWVIPIPIPAGATTHQPVPVEQRPADVSRADGRG
jgi:hypothetical protein